MMYLLPAVPSSVGALFFTKSPCWLGPVVGVSDGRNPPLSQLIDLSGVLAQFALQDRVIDADARREIEATHRLPAGRILASMWVTRTVPTKLKAALCQRAALSVSNFPSFSEPLTPRT